MGLYIIGLGGAGLVLFQMVYLWKQRNRPWDPHKVITAASLLLSLSLLGYLFWFLVASQMNR